MDNQLQPSRTVYCYYFPEMREIISRVTNPYPHEIYLQSMDPGLDDFHEPAIASYVEHMREQMPGLGDYPYRYTSNGASEAIFHILSYIVAFRQGTPLYVFEGEYEGYAGYGGNLGLTFTAVPLATDPGTLPKGIFFVSNPSARDGNILPNENIAAWGNAGHEIVLDATYVGLTDKHEFLVNHPSTLAVLVSLSKPFGLYYYRIGFTFMRQELLTLMVNKWFKNVLNHIIAKQALEQFHSSEFVEKYKHWQARASAELAEKYGAPIKPADVLLLAQVRADELSSEQQETLKTFRRGDGYRFCLTPYFLAYEREQA